MTHLTLAFLIISTLAGFCAVLLFGLIYGKQKSALLKYFIVILCLGVADLAFLMTGYYIFSFTQAFENIKAVLLIISHMIHTLMVYYFPVLAHNLAEMPFKRVHSISFKAVAAIHLIVSFVSFYIFSIQKSRDITAAKGLAVIGDIIFFIIYSYGIYILVKGIKKVKNYQLRKIIIVLFIILIMTTLGEIFTIINEFIRISVSTSLVHVQYVCMFVSVVLSIAYFYVYFARKMHLSAATAKIPVSFMEANGLSEKEGEVLQLMLENKSYSEISRWLFISQKTVEKRINGIYKKLSVKNKTELMNLIDFHSQAEGRAGNRIFTTTI